MRKLILLVLMATMTNLLAVALLLAQPGAATNPGTPAVDPHPLSSIPYLPLHTLPPVY